MKVQRKFTGRKAVNLSIENLDTLHEGECIETIVKKAVNSVEPITATVPIIYTDRAEGISPQYDPRTDRWEIACEASGKVAESQLARREAWLNKIHNIPTEPIDPSQAN